MGDNHDSPLCGIDDDTVEMHAMRRLPEGPTRRHLMTCKRCMVRVTDHAALIAELKEALLQYQATESEKRRTRQG